MQLLLASRAGFCMETPGLEKILEIIKMLLLTPGGKIYYCSPVQLGLWD